MFHKMLGEASDDLERVMPQSHESLHAVTTRNKHRCSRPETLSEKHCSRSETTIAKACSPSVTFVGMPCSRSETPSGKSVVPIPPSPPNRSEACAVKLEQVVDGVFHQQLELSVPLFKPEERKYGFKMTWFSTSVLNLLFTEAERMGKTRNIRMYIRPAPDGSSADKLSPDLKFNPWDTAITFKPEWRSMGKSHVPESRVARRCQNVLSSTNAPWDRCSSVSACSLGHNFVDRICLPLVCTKKITRTDVPTYATLATHDGHSLKTMMIASCALTHLCRIVSHRNMKVVKRQGQKHDARSQVDVIVDLSKK